MTFPTTSILDNFNRADTSNISGSSSWGASTLFGQSAFGITSNQLDTIAANCNNIWTPTYTDTEVYITINDAMYGTNRIALGARFSGSGSTPNGYFVFWKHDNDTIGFYKYTSGASSQIGTDISIVLSAGDKFGMSVIGNTLTAYAYQSGAWSSIGSQTDSTYTSAGYLWVFARLNSTANLMDDFGGGEVVSSSAVPIFYHQLQQQGIS